MSGHDQARERLRGIVLLVLSACLYGGVDALSKILADTQSVGQIVWARYALALPVLLLTVRPGDWTTLFRTARPGLQFIRGLTPLVISGTMVLAVRHLPLAEATVILFAGPFLVVALSVPVLGERVSGASWAAVIVGFVAVLIVAQPGFGQLSTYVLYPLVAAVFFAFFQLLTRRLSAAGEHPGTTLAWTLAIGAVAATPVAAFTWAPVSATGWMLMIALGIVFGLAQLLFVRAFTHATAGVLAPFSYAQIISATILSIAVFGDVPDVWTFVGMAMIIGAGVYVARSRAPG